MTDLKETILTDLARKLNPSPIISYKRLWRNGIDTKPWNGSSDFGIESLKYELYNIHIFCNTNNAKIYVYHLRSDHEFDLSDPSYIEKIQKTITTLMLNIDKTMEEISNATFR